MARENWACLYAIFVGISLITKNIGLKFIDDSSLIAIIFSIDLYIMLLLNYFYTQLYKKGN